MMTEYDEDAQNLDGNKPNAVQHMYWNALMALKTDSKTAEKFATAHEVLTPEQYADGEFKNKPDATVLEDIAFPL